MHRSDNSIVVLHVFPKLTQGGVETVVSNIMKQSKDERIRHELLVLNNERSFAGEFKTLSERVHFLPDMSLPEQRALARQTDVVHVGHRKAAFLVTPFARFLDKPIILGIHLSPAGGEKEEPALNRLFNVHVTPRLARQASGIVCCMDKIAQDVVARGWDRDKVHLITNGIDTRNFTRSEAAGEAVRRQLDIPREAQVVGIAARYAPMKDIPNFIAAAKKIAAQYPPESVMFLLSGNGMSADNAELIAQLKTAGIFERSRLAGVRNDMPDLYCATDVLTLSSSKNEALSMALLEGTAAGCLCVSTEVGDHKTLMERTGGLCVPIKDPGALAAGIDAQLRLPCEQRETRRRAGREAIVNHYDVSRMAAAYNALFAGTALRARNVRSGAMLGL